MKKHTITTYEFDELTDQAKQKALENLYDLNVDYDWWDVIYMDAETIGLKITSFDIDYAGKIEGELLNDGRTVAQKILSEHGPDTPTYKIANDYTVALAKMDDHPDFEWPESDFKQELLREYLTMLKQEYEYQTTEEAIIETIKANEYEFTAKGELWQSI